MMTKKVEFILAYNPGGTESLMARKAWHPGQSRKLSAHISAAHTYRKQEDQLGGGEKQQTLKAQSRRHISSSKAPSPNGHITSLNNTQTRGQTFKHMNL